mgnify:CR=1 FL=1
MTTILIFEISLKTRRISIKEIISNNIKNIEESDLLFKKKNDWIEEKKELKNNLKSQEMNLTEDLVLQLKKAER